MTGNRNPSVSTFQCNQKVGRFKSGAVIVFGILVLISEAMSQKEELFAVIKGTESFTTKLYNILAEKPGNLIFSPLSAHAVLSMTYQGAQGETLEAFSKSLDVPNHPVAAIGYKDIINHLNNVSGVELLMANKIYIQEGHALKSAFKDAIEKNFLSEVQPLNFSESVASADKINSWVENKTQNKITNLIRPDYLDSSTRLVLVNAIYFKGNWATKFKKESTKTEKFYINENDSIDVQMMNNKAKFLYSDNDALDAKILELPYSNRDVSLLVILPNKRDGIKELERKLTETDLSTISMNLYKTEVTVKLPKFKIESTLELNDPLRKIGLGEIFADTANFSGMLESPELLHVSNVIQKAFIEVNEEGTEAAAATGISVSLIRCGVPRIPSRKFIADHPFVVILQTRGSIVDTENQSRIVFNAIPLFQGRVLNPPV